MTTGLKPRDFVWVIADRLATAERIGGHGFQHRRVRREEELAWLASEGITAVVSLLSGNQNLASYESMGMSVIHQPLDEDYTLADVSKVFVALAAALSAPGAKVLLHRDHLDEPVAGVLAGYLVYSGMIDDPIIAAAVIQEILGRPLGPEARAMIPAADAAR
jgi:hypothetical protein